HANTSSHDTDFERVIVGIGEPPGSSISPPPAARRIVASRIAVSRQNIQKYLNAHYDQLERHATRRPRPMTVTPVVAAAPLLWHTPLSPFSEKVRWALDLKHMAHRRRVLGPDYLIRAWRATGRGTLPILFLEGRPIGDSTRIIEALEQHSPEPALYPRDP